MSNWDEDDHPRVPAGKGDASGQWVSAEIAGREAAGLNYRTRGGGLIWKVRAGEPLPEALEEHLRSLRYRVGVIFNAITRTWHIAHEGGIYHAEFTKSALEEVDAEILDAVLARGYFGIDSGDLDMWDIVEVDSDKPGIRMFVDEITMKRLAYIFKSTVRSTEAGLFSYRLENGKMTTPYVTWSALSGDDDE